MDGQFRRDRRGVRGALLVLSGRGTWRPEKAAGSPALLQLRTLAH